MDKSKTHKKYTIAVLQSVERFFEFLVPNHQVDEEGNIDKEILNEIRYQFMDEQLSFDDCEEGSACGGGTFCSIPNVAHSRDDLIEFLGNCSLTDDEIIPVYDKDKL
jgi:hypothetical protein